MHVVDTLKTLQISDITCNELNPRHHSIDQLKFLENSIKQFGFVSPVIVDSEHELIAGHARLRIAKRLKLKEIPAIVVDHLSRDQKKALLLADNQIASKSFWDVEKLSVFVETIDDDTLYLPDFGFEIDFSNTETNEFVASGFDDMKLDESDTEPKAKKSSFNDQVLARASVIEPLLEKGVVYELGKHRVLCGDACDPKSYELLLQNVRCPLMITDPPYGVDYAGVVRYTTEGKGDGYIVDTVHRRSLKNDVDLTWVKRFIDTVSDRLNGYFYAFCSVNLFCELSRLIEDNKQLSFLNQLIWCKTHFSLSTKQFKMMHENIFFGSVKKNLKVFEGYKCLDKNLTTILTNEKRENAELHSTPKPVDLLEKLLHYSSKPTQLVLDPFCGSGSTLIACENENRYARVMDLDIKHVATTIARYETHVGKKVI